MYVSIADLILGPTPVCLRRRAPKAAKRQTAHSLHIDISRPLTHNTQISVPLFFYVKWCRSRSPHTGVPLVAQGGSSNQLTGGADDRPGLQMMPSGVWNKPNI